MYRPDCRVKGQQYCSAAACQIQSKTDSQRRWIARPCNRDFYQRGSYAVRRVRIWRKDHPEYGKVKAVALQETISAQPSDAQPLKAELFAEVAPLQDLKLAEHPLIVGLAAHLFGPLQDPIASYLARIQAHGQAILGKGPGFDRRKGVGSEKRAEAGFV
jgi:hypothetical protein